MWVCNGPGSIYSVDVLISQREIVTVTETSLTFLASVVATVLLTLTLMEFVTT